MRYLLIFLICNCIALTVGAQTITGTVKDEKGAPLDGVTVTLKGTKVATETNDKGAFTIQAPGTGSLEFTMIGFAKQIIAIQNKQTLTVSMALTESRMDEAVVIGYQKISRKKNTAAVSSISGKELANLPAASFDQLLQGRLAGVNVQNFTGEPGASPSVQVRGTTTISREYDGNVIINQPLYVVDGIPQPAQENYAPGSGTGTNFIAGINPQDIESVDVLRDASAAAIYGSRAANGVILVTTKKGTNTAPRVNLSLYTGLTQRPELRRTTLGVTERRQKMEMLNDLYAQQRLNDGQMRDNFPFLLTDSLNPAFNGNTDWQDVFYQVGRINNADLSLSGGGNGGMTYRFSSGYYNEEGILKATGFTRYTMRLNLLAKALNQKLTINPIIAYSRTQRSRGSGSVGLTATTMPSSLFNLSPAKKEFMLGRYNDNLDQNENGQFTVNLNLGLELGKHLNFTSQSSYLNNTSRRDQNRTNELNSGNGSSASAFSDNGMNLRTSNYFNYVNSFVKHNLSVIAGSDVEYNQYKSISASGSGGVADQIQVVQGYRQQTLGASSNYEAYSLLSYYARFAYDFDSRYVVSGVVRGDGSSRYGDNNKWGLFPSASAAWLISEEKFMKNRTKSKITLLKLRGSYGTAGKLPGSNYLAYNLYRVSAGGYYGNTGASSYNGVPAITPNFSNGVAQPNISWERSKEWNIGTEIEFNNGKYQVMFDVYNKEGSSILMDVLLPLTTGYDLAKTNSNGIRNSGVELVLAASPLKRSSPVNWFTRLNISYNRNRIMSLPNSGRDLIFSNGSFDRTHVLSVGRPVNSFYLYQTRGIFSTNGDIPINPLTGDQLGVPGAYKPGDMWIYDLDGDYLIDPFQTSMNPDKIPYGDPNPKFTGGWTNNFTYKNFNASIFTSFVFDRDVMNTFDSDVFENVAGTGDISYFARLSTPDFSTMNIWRKPGDVADYPAYPLSAYRYYTSRAQTFWLENGNYVRIKSISLSYDLPNKIIKKWKMGQFRIYGVMDNVAMFQASDRLPDAEAVDYYGTYSGGGYPIPKKYTLGIQVQF